MLQLPPGCGLRPLCASIAVACCLSGEVSPKAQGTPVQPSGRTTVAVKGSMFTINGQPTYTAASGFPNADSNLTGTLLNVRAVQAVFDDANYPNGGTKAKPYASNTMGQVFFDYPDGKFDADRNVQEFVEALPEWRKAGLLAFTVNRDGFQSPPVNWRISTPVKWQFFEQVARLTGSPLPERPTVNDPEYPVITVVGLKPGQVLTKPSWIEAIVQDKHARWPIQRVEFFIDGKPFSYKRNAADPIRFRDHREEQRPDGY